MNANRILAIALLASCGATTKAATGPFAACSETALKDVASLIESNPASLESDLTAYGVTLGVAAVLCAIQAAEAVIKAPVGSGMTAHAALPGLSRALKWADEHRTAK
jgi:hypothetical protein